MLFFVQGPLAGVGGHRCGFSLTGELKSGPKWQKSPMKTTLPMNLYSHFNRTMFPCLCTMHTTMLLRVEVLLGRELAIVGKSGHELFNHGIPSMFPKFPKFLTSRQELSLGFGNSYTPLCLSSLPRRSRAGYFCFGTGPTPFKKSDATGKQRVCCLISTLGR
jgi:hypothetical protein